MALSQQIQELVNNKNWAEAYKLASNKGTPSTEKEEVIDLFLEQRFDKSKKIDDGKNVIVKLIEELGFSYNTNPFLSFLDIYFETHDAITEDMMVILNDLYADQKISTLELQGKTRDGKQYILFNQNLYAFKYDDAEFIIAAFKWLANEKNIEKFMTNPEARAKYNIGDGARITEAKAKEIRNKVLFEDPQNQTTSKIYPVDKIQTETRFFEAGGDVAQSYEQTKKSLNISPNIQDEAKWKKFISSETLTAPQVQDLIAYLAKEYKLI